MNFYLIPVENTNIRTRNLDVEHVISSLRALFFVTKKRKNSAIDLIGFYFFPKEIFRVKKKIAQYYRNHPTLITIIMKTYLYRVGIF